MRLKRLHIGGFAAFTDRPAGSKSRRGRTHGKFDFFPSVSVAGNRTRLGAEVVWFYGPASIKYEYLHAEEDRDGLADDGGDLPSLETNGWYVAFTYVLTGEKKKQKGMASGLEAVVRWEECEFEDNSDALADNRVEAVTLGFTYYFNKSVTLKLNYTHFEYSNEHMTPTSYINHVNNDTWVGDDGSDLVQARFQLVF